LVKKYIITSPKKINKNLYLPDAKNLKAYYGLNKNVKFCSNCTYSNQKPNSEKEFKHKLNTKKISVVFNKKNICNACGVQEFKSKTDWKKRKDSLKRLCDKHRKNDGSYDCLIPGSGGKDSFYTSYKLKYEYGMNPLTITYAPHIHTDWGYQNFKAWINTGFDNFLFTPNTKIHRLLSRLALENLFHPFQPFMFGQNYLSPKIAAQKFKIKLVFYGESPLEYGNQDNRFSPIKDPKYYTSKDPYDSRIAGIKVKDLIKNFSLKKSDLESYLPISIKEFKKCRTEIHYLGFYIPWHPQEAYYFAVDKGGFKPSPERTAGTYSKYSSIDDKIDDLHYYTTFIKFGMGRATYDSAQEIRNQEINREEGKALIKKYDGEYSARFEKEIFEYLSITKQEFPKIFNKFEHPTMNTRYFELLANKFRSPHLWMLKDKKWKLRHKIYQ
jgi:N-acetyl sugar amidotransferase